MNVTGYFWPCANVEQAVQTRYAHQHISMIAKIGRDAESKLWYFMAILQK